VEPKYSSEARADRIQGTVVLQIVVNEQGRATNIGVISPLGFGLDEQVVAAIEQWKFAPGVKDGKPVRILATVEVNFRFPQIWFDQKAERQRTAFNLALEGLKQGGKSKDRAIASMHGLSQGQFPAAIAA
jgi:TonB family protein